MEEADEGFVDKLMIEGKTPGGVNKNFPLAEAACC